MVVMMSKLPIFNNQLVQGQSKRVGFSPLLVSVRIQLNQIIEHSGLNVISAPRNSYMEFDKIYLWTTTIW